MNLFEKPIQKHYRFPFFSLPREVRDIIYRALFISDDLVVYDHFGIDNSILGTYQTLEIIYEATTSLRFLQESLEMFFRENIFIVQIYDMPYLLKYRSLSLRTKEQMALPPYIPEEAIKLSTAWQLGQPPVIHSADYDPYWVMDENEEMLILVPSECYSILTEDEEKVSKFSPRKALEMSTWIRSILVPIPRFSYMKYPEPCLLELCKLPNLQHVSIMTEADKWPLMQSGQPAAAACLKELRSRFGKGLRLIYHGEKRRGWLQVPDSFIDLLCARTDNGEGENEWEEDWLEGQFHPLKQSMVDHLRSC